MYDGSLRVHDYGSVTEIPTPEVFNYGDCTDVSEEDAERWCPGCDICGKIPDNGILSVRRNRK